MHNNINSDNVNQMAKTAAKKIAKDIKERAQATLAVGDMIEKIMGLVTKDENKSHTSDLLGINEKEFFESLLKVCDKYLKESHNDDDNKDSDSSSYMENSFYRDLINKFESKG